MPQETSVSSSVWLLESVDRALRCSLNDSTANGDIIIISLIQRAMLREMILSEFDNAPWAIVHQDLYSANLIIDDDTNTVEYWFFACPS